MLTKGFVLTGGGGGCIKGWIGGSGIPPSHSTEFNALTNMNTVETTAVFNVGTRQYWQYRVLSNAAPPGAVTACCAGRAAGALAAAGVGTGPRACGARPVSKTVLIVHCP